MLAIGLRLEPILLAPSVVWPDEIFQSIEQAHRLVYGAGLAPWEFELGIRSWLLPGVITALMELARLVGDGPDYYLPVVAAAFAALGAAPAVCSFLWARRLLGLPGAVVAGAVAATAPELVYFGARALSEVVAGNLLVLAVYLLEPGYRVTSRRRLFCGGALLGLSCVLRIQLLPGLAVIGLWTVWSAPRQRMPAILAGGAAILAFAALLDWATLGSPLASLWRYALYNVYYGVSATFGVEPWYYYVQGELAVWGGASGLILVLILSGARRLPLLPVAAFAVLAAHSVIPHKEYRFIYPAVLLLTAAAGVGLAGWVDWGQKWLVGRGFRRAIAAPGCIVAALSCWWLLSVDVWTGPTLKVLRERFHDNLAAASYVSHQLAPFGIGLYGLAGKDWGVYGGYTYFHRPVPLYWPKDETELIATEKGFDTLLYTRLPPPRGSGFAPRRCFGRVCLAQRAGGCRDVPMMAMPVPAPLADIANAKLRSPPDRTREQP